MLDAVFLANLRSSYFVPAISHALDIRLCHAVDKKTVKSCTSFKFHVTSVKKTRRIDYLILKLNLDVCVLGTKSFMVQGHLM